MIRAGDERSVAGGRKSNPVTEISGTPQMYQSYMTTSSAVLRSMTLPLFRLSKQWRKRVVWMWLAVGLGIAASVFGIIWSNSQHSHRAALQRRCEEYAAFFENQFNATSSNAATFADLISTYYYTPGHQSIFDRSAFVSFISTTPYARPLISMIAYAHRVQPEERREFERHMGNCVFPWLKFGSCAAYDGNEVAPVMQYDTTFIGALMGVKGDIFYGMDSYGYTPVATGMQQVLLDGLPYIGCPLVESAPQFKAFSSAPTYIIQVFPVFNNSAPTRPIHPSSSFGEGDLAASAPTPSSTPSSPTNTTASYVQGWILVMYNFTSLLTDSSPIMQTMGNIQAVLYDKVGEDLNLLFFPPSLKPNSFSPKDFTLHLPIYFGDLRRSLEMRCRYRQGGVLAMAPILWSMAALVVALLVTLVLWATMVGIERMERDYERMVLLRDRMQEAKLTAEAASRAKGAFLATMSHEIRTPMNGVIGMLNLLMQTPLDMVQLDYVETARASGRALCTLINDILDLSKIEAEKLELESIAFDIRQEVEQVLGLFSAKVAEKPKTELAAFVADSVPCVVIGDTLRFRQILVNLVGNALKFTEEGHVFLFVRVEFPGEVVQHLVSTSAAVEGAREEGEQLWVAQEGQGEQGVAAAAECILVGQDGEKEFLSLSGRRVMESCSSWSKVSHLMHVAKVGSMRGSCNYHDGDSVRLVISVEDTGCGIPEKAQHLIFRPFTQADTSTTRSYGGTGIGLSICQRLVNMMSGTMSFVSMKGVGTTFFFDLELRCGGPLEPCEGGGALLCAGHVRARGGLVGEYVVLFDDRPVRRAVTASYLRRLGLHVCLCADLQDLREVLGPRGLRSGLLPSIVLSSPNSSSTAASSWAAEAEVAPPPASRQNTAPALPARPMCVSSPRTFPEPMGSGLRPLTAHLRRHPSSAPSPPLSHSKSCRGGAYNEDEEQVEEEEVQGGMGAPPSVSVVLIEEQTLIRKGLTAASVAAVAREAVGKAAERNGMPAEGAVVPRLVLLQQALAVDSNAARGFDGVVVKPLRRESIVAALLPLFSPAHRSAVGGGAAGEDCNSPVKFRRTSSLRRDSMAAVASPGRGQSQEAEAAASPARGAFSFSPAATDGDAQPDGFVFEDATVCVVDDNAVNRKVMERMLGRFKVNVVSLAGGQDAVDFLGQPHSCSLVFMDLQMPDMDGVEATRQIRKRETERGVGKRVPVVALTADLDSATKEMCMAASMDAFLLKPIEDTDLARTLTTFLSRASQK